MEERMGEAFAGTKQFTIVGKCLHAGDQAPDFCLDFLDLADLAVHTVGLADSAGLVRLLNMVNSLERPVCQRVTRQWEALCAELPPDACIYTVSMDWPQMQARWQDTVGVLHKEHLPPSRWWVVALYQCEQSGAERSRPFVCRSLCG